MRGGVRRARRLSPGEVPADAQVAQGRRVVAQQIVEARGVVVRVRVAIIGGDGAPVGLQRVRVVPGVLQHDAQVEAGGRIVGADRDGAPVVLLGGGQVTALVQDASQV